MCLAHAEEHGDATLVQRLYNELPNGQRREALLEWVNAYSPVRVTQKGQKVGMLKETSPKFVPFNLTDAEANPYWTQDERSMFKFDSSLLSFNTIVQAALQSKLKGIDNAVKKHDDPESTYELDFDPEEARNALIAEAAERGFTLEAN